MPSFEIPDGPTTVKLVSSLADAKAPRTGSVVYSVNNKASDTRAGRLSVQAVGQTKAEWFTIEGEQERKFDPANSETVSVKLSVPGDVAAGNYSFRLRVVAVNDPDNDFADGPSATAEVAAPVDTGGGGIKPWVWIVAALVLLVIIGGALFYFLHKPSGETPPPEPTVTATATATTAATAPVPDLSGHTLAEAKTLAVDFKVNSVPGAVGGKPPTTVISQIPAAGTVQTKGFPIEVTVDPGVVVPKVADESLTNAINILNSRGLKVASASTHCENSGVDGAVISQDPAQDAVVSSAQGVTLVVRDVPQQSPNGMIMLCRRLIFQGAEVRNMAKAVRFGQ